MVWVVSSFRLKAPPGISSSCISPFTSSGQRSRASLASQPQKSATLSPQPGGKPRKFIRTCGGNGEYIYIYISFQYLLINSSSAGSVEKVKQIQQICNKGRSSILKIILFFVAKLRKEMKYMTNTLSTVVRSLTSSVKLQSLRKPSSCLSAS